MIKEVLKMVEQLEAEEQALQGDAPELALRRRQLERDRRELLESCHDLPAEDRVYLARHPRRPKIDDYIAGIFTDFFEQRGDRQCREDASILGGVALFHGQPVTVIGHRKGHNMQESMKYNFGMPGPEGYRKALRLMEQAQKFGRPIITFIDTPGAYPGKDAEARGQAAAIARTLAEMSKLDVPVIAVVTGEGSSGGALALGVANRVLMLENAIYSVLSPEGFASILWRDAARSQEACRVMKLTAQDLTEGGVIEQVIAEPDGGAQADPGALFAQVDKALQKNLEELCGMSAAQLREQRYEKFRRIGRGTEESA